jgi:hypothetical protein
VRGGGFRWFEAWRYVFFFFFFLLVCLGFLAYTEIERRQLESNLDGLSLTMYTLRLID